jgi:S1-C subfamily serine protease
MERTTHTTFKLRLFGWCFVLFVLGSVLSGCASMPVAQCVGNCVNGQGTLILTNGDQYVGDFRNNQRNGQGIYTFTSGNQYVGEWRDNQQNGQGTFTFTNGDQYVGDFRNNQRSGQGAYTFANGNQYVGEWRDNLRTGQGTLTAADGSVRRGRWVNGNLVEPQENPPQSQAPERVADNEEPIEAGSGTGFFVSADGHLITNQHVIESCNQVFAYTGSGVHRARVLASDSINDIALLQIEESSATFFTIDSTSPYLLQDIYVAGFPFGNSISSSIKVTSGIVSSLVGIGNNVSNIQIDAALQPGNSGGPIIDEFGNVVGIAVAKLDYAQIIERFDTIPENTNFGIKASVATNILAANNVQFNDANRLPLSQAGLGELLTNATVYLGCWMTASRIEEVRSRKTLFQGL